MHRQKLKLGGGKVRLTEADGSIVEANCQVIAYSAKTAHMFEQSTTKTMAVQGNPALGLRFGCDQIAWPKVA
jgi:phage gp45-like